jgi:hypothetical protein
VLRRLQSLPGGPSPPMRLRRRSRAPFPRYVSRQMATVFAPRLPSAFCYIVSIKHHLLMALRIVPGDGIGAFTDAARSRAVRR